MISEDHPLVLIGCGNMGAALAQGWRSANVGPMIIIDSDEKKLQPFLGDATIATYASVDGIIQNIEPGAICLATKPDKLTEVLHLLSDQKMSAPPLVFSVAAGMELSFYEQHLWAATPTVRIMPNLAATIDQSMSVCIANAHVSSAHKALITELCEAVGKVLWLYDESLMDAVTAISGSGPAYFFAMFEAMITQAISFGLSENEARLLVVQTAVGASLFASQSEIDISQMREAVTSAGGTTQAALDVLLEPKNEPLFTLLSHAMNAAKERSEKLRNL